MDGRGALRWSTFLLLAAAGCQHQVMTLPNSSPLAPGERGPNGEQSPVKVTAAKPKELPPQVWVSAGDFKASEARAPDNTPDRRQQLFDLARVDYEQALKIDPKYVPAYMGLARLDLMARDTPLAAETYQKALLIAPNNAQIWYELGMCHHAEKNWQPALECLSRATQIDPRNRNYANAKAVVLAESGRYDESLSCFIHTSGEALGNYRLALTLQRLQRPDLSQHYLETAANLDPSLAPTLAQNSGGAAAVNPRAEPIQQTAYPESEQDPNASAAPLAPAAMPSAIPQGASNSENAPSQQRIIPPTPSVNAQYERP